MTEGMTEAVLDDLFVLESLEAVTGAQRHLCWDQALDRQTWLWRLDTEDTEMSGRLSRWASLDHPSIAVVHARGAGPTGVLITTQFPGTQTLPDWVRAEDGVNVRTRAFLEAIAGLIALSKVRLAALAEEVFVDDGRLLLAAVHLDRDGGDEDVLEAARSIATTLELDPSDLDAIVGAEDTERLRSVCSQIGVRLDGPTSRRGRRWIVGLAIAASVGGVVGALWRAPPESPEDPCRSIADAAEAWRRTSPAVVGPAGDELRGWLDGWASVAEENCRDGAARDASAALVGARQQCLDEHLAALQGVWAAHGEQACAQPSCPSPRQLLPPPDACAWGHEEAYLHRPWRERPTSSETIQRIARRRALAGLSGVLPDAQEFATTPPRWRSWVHDAEARTAPDDAAWRRASWAAIVDAISAGDELGGLQAMVSRALGAEARGLDLHPSPEALARSLAERVTSSYGGSLRVQAWVDAELARLDTGMR